MSPYVAISILATTAITIVLMRAKSSKSAFDQKRHAVLNLSTDEARTRWEALVANSTEWTGNISSLTRQGIAGLNEVEFLPAGLVIGNGDYNPPKSLADEYQIIGVTGNEDFAWICCRHNEDTVWELDGTESGERERKSGEFPSIYHYLLFEHTYYLAP